MDKKIKDRIDAIRQGSFDDQYAKTEIGILPRNWRVARLSDIAEKLTQTAGTDSYETVSISAGIGFVNQVEKFGKELSGKQYEKYIVLHKGDFSYNKGNSNKYPQGCIYRLKDRETAAAPNVFESFRVKTGCPDYYDQLLTSGYLNRQLYRLINHGVRDNGLLNLTQEDFYSCMLPVPPVPEQERIAEILKIQDRVVELCEKKIEQLKNLKKVFLQKMFPKSGCNIPEWRFPQFTDAWEQRKLGDIMSCVTDYVAAGSFSDIRENVTYLSKPDYAQLVRTVDLKNKFKNHDFIYVDKNAFEYLWRVNLNEECIVLPNIGANIGEVYYIEPLELPQDNNVLGPNAILLRTTKDKYFVFTALTTDSFQNQLFENVGSSGQPKFNKTELKTINMLVPSLAEQRKIGEIFQQLDHLITLHQCRCDEEKEKKKALMQLLLIGRVRIKT